MSIWAPVVAALGASALTGAFGLGTIRWQERRKDRAADLDRRGSAYLQLIARSLSFSTRAATLRNTMQLRSGAGEGLDVALRVRRPADPLALHDWFAQAYEPINEAWSTIQMIGSPHAIDAATQLLDACGDLLAIATRPGEARGKVLTAIVGMGWTPEQESFYQAALERLVKEREALIKIARSELGRIEIGARHEVEIA